MYKEEVIISSNDIDASLHVKIACLMRIIQDVIMHHTEVLGVGQSETIDKNIIWVVTRIKMEITRLPKYQEKVVIKTYPGQTTAILYPRYLYIEDMNGNVIFRLSSIWALLNKETRQVTNSKIISERIVPEVHENELPLPEKVDIGEDIVLKETRKVHYSDVDLNGHLNFTKYIEYFEDLHNNDFYGKHHPKTIILNYSKEIKEGQTVNIYAFGNEVEKIKITSDSGDHLFAEIHYQ